MNESDIPQWRLGAGMPNIAADVGVICLVFSRQEVEGLRVGRAVDDLMTLSDNARLFRQLQHGLFLTFDGWGDDPREVHQIQACRDYLAAIHRQWPYWLHFLAPVADQWAVLLLCLAGRIAPAQGTRPGMKAMSVEVGEIHELVDGMLAPLSALHDAMGLTQDEGAAVFDRSLEAIAEALT